MFICSLGQNLVVTDLIQRCLYSRCHLDARAISFKSDLCMLLINYQLPQENVPTLPSNSLPTLGTLCWRLMRS